MATSLPDSLRYQANGLGQYTSTSEVELILDAARSGVTGDLLAGINPSPSYKFMFPLTQPVSSGLPRDISTNGEVMYALSAATDATAWANKGYLSVPAGNNTGWMINKSDVDLSINDSSNLLFAFAMLKAQPAAEEIILGNSAAGTSGFVLSVTSTGKLKLTYRTATLATSNTTTSFTVADGTDHQVCIFFNNLLGRIDIFVDGWFDRSLVYQSGGLHHTIPQGSDLGIGCTNGADQACNAVQIRGLHAFLLSDIPANLPLIAQRLARSPTAPITVFED